jgi:hypothetical protein
VYLRSVIVIVHHFQNANGRYESEVNAAIGPSGHRIVGDVEDEAPLAVQIDGKLLVAVARELMTPEGRCSWNIPKVLERREFLEALADARAQSWTPPVAKAPLVLTRLLELPGGEHNIHEAPESLTYWVYLITNMG